MIQVGDIVTFYENGERVGKVKKIGREWIHVECVGKDPRTKRVRKFRSDDLRNWRKDETVKSTQPEHPDQLEAKGQTRLGMNLGPREVPERREQRPDKGTGDLPLFNQPDERQLQIEAPPDTD